MATGFATVKRLLVGRPVQSERLGHTLLPKKIALPVFASDALSSVAYATQEILLVLAAGGIAYIAYTPWIALGVGLLMLVVVASYRQNVHAYPSGGGDYEVTTTNFSPRVGMTVASALMVDYTLTVAVSVSSGVANLASAFPVLNSNVTLIAALVVAVIAVMNLRGVRESGTGFAIPSYCFIGVVMLMIVWGGVRLAMGDHLRAETAGYPIRSTGEFAGLALVFLFLRAFSSGCTALTGVEAISNGVPAFKPPKSKNAATTLALLGGIAVVMFGGVTALALVSHVHAGSLGGTPAGFVQPTVIAQVGRAVFGYSSPLFYILQLFTALILVLAANTAFNGFPVLASILARDGFLPRQLHTRGDRLAFSNGILLLSGFAILLIIAFHASPTRLIQLYIVGVFVSFTCSQTGMIRHWNRLLRTTTDGSVRLRMMRSRAINTVGACVTGLVLVIVRHQQVRGRSLDRGRRDGGDLVHDERHPPPLRGGRRGADAGRGGRDHASGQQHRHRAGVEAAPPDAARARLRPRRPARPARGSHRRRRRGRDHAAEGGMGPPRHAAAADRGLLPLPGDHPSGHRVRAAAAPGEPARHRDGLRSRVRARALVGAGAAQPERAPPEDAPADGTRCHRGERALPARLRPAGRGDRRPAGRPAAARQPRRRCTPPRCASRSASCRPRTPISPIPIADCRSREVVDIAGTLRHVTLRPRGSTPAMEAELWDGTGRVLLVWLGRRDIPGIEPGRKIIVHGRMASVKGDRAIYNPAYELQPAVSQPPG